MEEEIEVIEVPNEKDESLADAFSRELLSPTLDLATDYSEIFIDDLFENGILKEIPLVKTIVGTVKTMDTVTRWWNAKKLITFIKEFNDGTMDPRKLDDFKSKFNADSKFRHKTIEQIIVFNDRFLDMNKSRISARLFIAFVQNQLNWEDFINLNVHLDKLHPESYKFLRELESMEYEVSQDQRGNKKFEEQALLLSSGLARETSAWSHGFKLNQDGIKLYELGIKPIL